MKVTALDSKNRIIEDREILELARQKHEAKFANE